MKCFIDSSYIIALVNENDSLHEKSLEFLDLINENECYISNLVINEVITVVGNKISLEVALFTYDYLNKIFDVINDYDDKNFNSKTMLNYEKYNAKLSFTDCGILTNMQNQDIDSLISFDKEFKKVENIKLIY